MVHALLFDDRRQARRVAENRQWHSRGGDERGVVDESDGPKSVLRVLDHRGGQGQAHVADTQDEGAVRQESVTSCTPQSGVRRAAADDQDEQCAQGPQCESRTGDATARACQDDGRRAHQGAREE